jgi:hypothetical protein
MPAMNDDTDRPPTKKRPEGRFFYHSESTDHFSTTAPFIIELWPGNEQKNS